MHLGIASDHGGFHLKEDLLARLRADGHDVVDFGARVPTFLALRYLSVLQPAAIGIGKEVVAGLNAGVYTDFQGWLRARQSC